MDGVIVVNPGFLSKRKAPGTYARLSIRPYSMTDEERGSATMVGHKVFERTRADILRI